MNIAIVGLGLIGGSIGLALKKSSRIFGIPRREETINQAMIMGAIDEGSLDVKKVSAADVVFICTPISLIIPKLKEITPHLKKGAVVTDVGSSKFQIVTEAQKLMPKGTFFIGGHPMAGKEKVKLEEAEASLFKNKTWVLIETAKTSQKAMKILTDLISKTGASVIKLDPKLHDLAVAGISHMPLAVAASLVNTIANAQTGREEMIECASSGFRDTTRIASGDPELGVDMFSTNKKAVLMMIKAFKASLSKLEKLIKDGNTQAITAELDKAKKFREKNVKLYN